MYSQAAALCKFAGAVIDLSQRLSGKRGVKLIDDWREGSRRGMAYRLSRSSNGDAAIEICDGSYEHA